MTSVPSSAKRAEPRTLTPLHQLPPAERRLIEALLRLADARAAKAADRG